MEPGELNPDTTLGSLSVNGHNVSNTAAWCLSNLVALLDDAQLRGGNKLLPHAVGVKAKRKRRTVTVYSFPLAVTGLYTPAGARISRLADRYMQLILNAETLRGYLGIGEDAPAGTTGTVAAVWTRPNASTKAADVHVGSPLGLEQHGFIMVGSLQLEVPYPGKFA